MCGRYALFSGGDALQRQFGLDATPTVQPSYNIAPGQVVPAIAWSREMTPRLLAPGMLWGFPMGDDEAVINARSETAHTKPTFSEAWQTRRCAIPFDAFYEWNRKTKPKQPWCLLAQDRPLAFGALYWPLNTPAHGARYGMAILTTEPNRDVADIHHRMPVILQPDEVAFFTDRDATPAQLAEFCRTPPADLFEARKAPFDVNTPAVDGPWLLGNRPSQLDG